MVAHDRRRLARVRHLEDERAVDLQLVHLDPGEEGQRGEAGAEVVHRQLHAHRPQRGEHLVDDLQLAHHHRLGDLQDQPIGRHLVPAQRVGDLTRQPAVEQAAGGEVDRDRYVEALPGPTGGDRQRLVQHVPGEGAQLVAVLHRPDELGRPEQAPAWVPPADQRLHAGRRSGGQVDGRLQHQHQLIVGLQRLAQLGEQGQLVGAGRVPGAVVRGHAGATVLGLVHGDVGPAQQLGQVGGAGRGHHHADGDLDRHPHPGHLGRRGQPLGDVPSLTQRVRHRGGTVRDHRVRGQQQGELVTAESGQQVAGAGQRLEPVGGQSEQLIAGRVPEGVVHLFELIDIQQQQRDRVIMGQLPQRLVTPAEHGRPVGQPGDRVVHRLVRRSGGDQAEFPVGRRVVQGSGEGVGEGGEDVVLAPTGRGRTGQADAQPSDLGLPHRQVADQFLRVGFAVHRRRDLPVGHLAARVTPVTVPPPVAADHLDVERLCLEQRQPTDDRRGGHPGLVQLVERGGRLGERPPGTPVAAVAQPLPVGLLQQPQRGGQQ